MTIQKCVGKTASYGGQTLAPPEDDATSVDLAQQRAQSSFVVAQAKPNRVVQECQFSSQVPIQLFANGEAIRKGSAVYVGHYVTTVNIPFDGNPVEIGVRANGWKQTKEITLTSCPPNEIWSELRADFGFENCREQSDRKHIGGYDDPEVEIGDTVVVMERGKTPREVDIPVTTNGSWTTPKALFPRNAEWPRIYFSVKAVSDHYEVNVPEPYDRDVTVYLCKGDSHSPETKDNKGKPLSKSGGYPIAPAKVCQPALGQLCAVVPWVFPDRPASTKGEIHIGENFYPQGKKCLGVYDSFGRKIATCSSTSEPTVFRYESLKLPNGSIWEPSRNRGDYLRFE